MPRVSVERVEISLLWVWLATLTFVAVLFTSPAFANSVNAAPSQAEQAYQMQAAYYAHMGLYNRCPSLYPKTVTKAKLDAASAVNKDRFLKLQAEEPPLPGKPRIETAELSSRLDTIRTHMDKAAGEKLAAANGDCAQLAPFKNSIPLPSIN